MPDGATQLKNVNVFNWKCYKQNKRGQPEIVLNERAGQIFKEKQVDNLRFELRNIVRDKSKLDSSRFHS